jgi:hypothetical protein
MENKIKDIIREELEGVMTNGYSSEDIMDAILNKHFIHTKSGDVYSPVKMDKEYIVGVNDDCQHVNIPLSEVTLIQTLEERFGK